VTPKAGPADDVKVAIKEESITGPDTTSGREASETEIFQQTLARIEAQRKVKEEQVRVKAEKEELARAEAARQREEAAIAAQQKALEEARSTGDTAMSRAIELTMEAARKDAEQIAGSSSMVAALKSDADPNLYLAEMKTVEQRIEADNKAQGKKNYGLRPIPDIYVPARMDSATEPALMESIERDRKVVDEHRAIAAEQELKLKERIRQDREAMGLADPELTEELRAAEDVAVAAAQERPAGGKAKLVEAMAAKKVEETVPAAETVPVVIAEVKLERPVETAPVPTTEKAAKPIPVVEQPEAATVAKIPVIPVEEPKSVEKQGQVAAPETVFPEPMKVEQAASTPVADLEVKESPVPTLSVPTAKVATVRADVSGREAALRDYGKRRVDFMVISDIAQRSLVQRLAAEDRGRLAVLKRLANAKATDAMAAQAMEGNARTREVLAEIRPAVAREEQMPAAFDRNGLRRRKNVDFRILVALGEFQLSEAVRESLDPLYLAQLQLPEFELLTDYQTTPVDARRTRNHLRDLGFANAAIAPMLNGSPISMSEAVAAPLVE
ncbi:MAG: hypothetical protein K9J06_16155, partial [Flavobacteriales bacterium]|nr:hypothetical protein [Flavobacteriales bacterium]